MDLDAHRAPCPSYWNLVFYFRDLSHTQSPDAFRNNRYVGSGGPLSVQVERTLWRRRVMYLELATLLRRRVMYLDSLLLSLLPRCRACRLDSSLFP